MNREIPGYYFDPEKKKYFKIEKTQTAPSSVAWSSDAVKRRKVEEKIQKSVQRRAHLVRNHIKRHFIAKDAVASALLAREVGLPYAAERGRGKLEDGDLGAAAWAGGLVAKGNVPFAPSFARQRYPNISCFYVSNEDNKTGLGVAYATLDEETLVGSYIPTNKNDSIRFSQEDTRSSGRALLFRNEMVRCPQMSSIKYHRPSHKMLLTSREPDHSCGLYIFSPLLSDPEDATRPQWLLGETNHYQRLSVRQGLHNEWMVHSSTPAPPSSDLICVLGSNNGLLQVRSNETLSAIAPRVAPKGIKIPQEIFAQDFQEGNHNVLLAGGRQPRLWITDFRAPQPQWSFAKHASSITHIKSVNPYQVLVSGLQSSMALYDVRFLSRNPRGTKPLLHFSGHRNEAHINIGWDVCPELNVVAAAQDNGTVKIFSLRSGRRLQCPAAESIHTDAPIKALMFQKMPRERMPSLFVGEGLLLRKLSLGVLTWDDEA
ncbi:myocyte-specific enhancer factor 2d [Fusarium langsethiae]|uniref:Myocyte-specific enhancer factor 2d n=1 Tax=Fusarium langsethiae TaxID=179993 RepID=A0A0M9ERT2_FUSLA|nr:myocyte-specific enhancer factor 2d [Fusarium langsethiae]GKU05671.1 unnamed protein product [Fusarium langsethiae]